MLECLALGVRGEPADLPVVQPALRPWREVEDPADQQGPPVLGRGQCRELAELSGTRRAGVRVEVNL
ncbi:hypothetical protein ACWGIU_37750 [Streptomyces sp. NPDC054840]